MRAALDLAVAVSAAALFLIAAIGGLDIDVGPLSIRIRDWLRPAVMLAASLGARAAIDRVRTQPPRVSLSAAAAYAATRGLLAVTLAAAGIYAQYHVRVAGGLDSYGYVSTAALIASGRLSEPQPLAATLPFPGALNAATPLGHVPAPDGRSSVPRFPLGLPFMMALASTLHPAAPFFVPLVMGYATLLFAYLLAREWSDRLTGLFAAALVAVDPVFAVSAIQPMSDVPATCWLLAALWAVHTDRRSESPPWSLGAGVCGGMAVLTRPVLLPAVLVLVALHFHRTRSRAAVWSAAAVFVIVLLQTSLNMRLYGAATMSGYGSASHMFEWSVARMTATLANFGKWLAYSRTVFFWLAWPAALVILRRDRRAWVMTAVGAAAAAPYLFYLVFDNWDSLRFLLPAIVMATIVCARGLADILGLTPAARAWRPAVLFAVVFGCACASARFAQNEGIGRTQSDEAKYPLVGEWFKNNTSERAVVLAGLHSGSIRMYGGRQTIRWDEIPEDALDSTIGRLVIAGYDPYLALDMPSEPPMFDERFRGKSIGVEPIARVRVVNIYRFMSAR